MLTDGLERCGLLWCFYQLFWLSFWRHPFTAEDQLLSKWCNAKFLQIWWRNKLIYILGGLRVSTFSSTFNLSFCVNYSLIPNITSESLQTLVHLLCVQMLTLMKTWCSTGRVEMNHWAQMTRSLCLSSSFRSFTPPPDWPSTAAQVHMPNFK